MNDMLKINNLRVKRVFVQGAGAWGNWHLQQQQQQQQDFLRLQERLSPAPSITTQACISNTPKASVTKLQSDECWVSLWRIIAFPHIYDVSDIKFHKLGQN